MTAYLEQLEAETLVIERVLDAPRELVWKAWTEPAMLRQWWGPTGFSAPRAEIDLRVGGKWLFSMRNPEFADGRELFSTGTYREIVPMERIVATDSFADERGNIVSAREYGMPDDAPLEMLLVITFEDTADGKTKLTTRHLGLPKSQREGANAGWNQSLDKLAALLAA